MATATPAPARAGGPTSHSLLQDGLDFEDAVRAAEKARIALTGTSGSGKTYTALSIGTGLLPEGGTLGVIDTERGSASKYAGLFTFKTMKLPTFEPQALIRALAVAATRGIDVIVIDSLTHFWSGRGGMLAQVDAKTSNSRSGNAFTTGWKDMRPVELDMLDAILAYPGHVIATMRVKTEWVIQENERGQKGPTKMGTKVDQRDGIDYEFDLVGGMDQTHVLTIDKSRYPTIEVGSRHDKPEFGFGRVISEWLDDGDASAPGVMDYAAAAIAADATHPQLLSMFTEVEQRGLTGAAVLGMDRQPVSLGSLIKTMGVGALVRSGTQSYQDLRALFSTLEQHGRLQALVPGVDGQPVGLGDLVRFAGEQKNPRTPAPQQPVPAAADDQGPAVTAPAAAPAAPEPPATEDPLGDVIAQVQRSWDNPDALGQVLVVATRQNLLLRPMQGPDGELYPVGELVSARINELKSPTSDRSAA